MKWPRTLTRELIEPLSKEERGMLLDGVLCEMNGNDYTGDSTSAVRVALQIIRDELAQKAKASEYGKRGGGNPALAKQPETEILDALL